MATESKKAKYFSKRNRMSDPCPCGLPYEDVRDLRLVGEGGVCTALNRENQNVQCGVLLANHPHRSSIQAPTGSAGHLLLFVMRSEVEYDGEDCQ